jgi:transcription termination factor NusB
MSHRLVEVDLVKRHYFDSDVHYSSGGQLFDRVQFQNDTESYFYERNGSSLGKGVIKQSMDLFDRAMPYLFMKLDFLAIRPLLDEVSVSTKITYSYDGEANEIKLSHRHLDKKPTDYIFDAESRSLVKIINRELNGVFEYSDYQTTRGFTFARTVYQYYDGAKEPSYVTFNNQFSVIKEIEASRLSLPQGYGPIIERGDGILVSKPIADDVYLVTDSSALRNGLIKVTGDKLMLFGLAGNNSIAQKAIELVKRDFPSKQLNAIYITHPHGQQIAGLATYARLGVEIYADQYTINAIQAFPAFSEENANFKFKTVEHEDSANGVQFFVLENMHSKRQGFAFFTDSNLIFQSHFLHIAKDNTIPKVIPNYTRTFINFIREEDLSVDRIISNYRNNNVTISVLNKVYDSIL